MKIAPGDGRCGSCGCGSNGKNNVVLVNENAIFGSFTQIFRVVVVVGVG